ncbi:hypothetical protein PRZ48_012890 [Zasmidium cellare]|uniref:Glycoside hydrolase family 76 protein n=1 Tax=Zasmidium cellare TaxID=395010 RepID=A0ABR0E2G6_ZASCE|nr:hypothetical protein PRZ48_012890 [Zasmidium cellare]
MKLLLGISTLAFAFSAQAQSDTENYAISLAEAAFRTLQSWYDSSNGLYGTCPSCWWETANAITTITNLMILDPGTTQYVQPVFENTYAVSSNQQGNNNWLGYNYDDDGWWALAWIAAYDATGDTKYLSTAENIFDAMQQTWGTNCYNGGIYWNQARNYVNAITNELFMSVAAHLSNRPTSRGAGYYSNWAQVTWSWFQQTGMINGQGLINDGLDGNCNNNQGAVFTYNQGVVLGALAELYTQTGNQAFLGSAEALAGASIGALTNGDQILTEPCGANCDSDQTQFKGIYIRNLVLLNSVDPHDEYAQVISASANSIWANDQDSSGYLGVLWEGPFVNGADFSTQSSAMDALNAFVQINQ